jgi:general secretion pathway protein F
MLFKVRALQNNMKVVLQIEAPSAASAAADARRQGYNVLKLSPVRGFNSANLFTEKFPLNHFSRDMHAMLEGGLSLVESLEVLAEKESKAKAKATLIDVLQHINQGESFSMAISHFPESFPGFYVATLKASEQTGNLMEALSRFIAYDEQVDQLRKKIQTASIYPLILLVLGTLVVLFLLGYVTPKFAAIYAENLENLPWASRVLIATGQFIERNTLIVVTGLLILAGGISALMLVAHLRAYLVKLIWQLPTVGEFLNLFHLTRFYRTTGMLLNGGIPAVVALEMSAEQLHFQLREQLNEALRNVREGRALSESMSHAGLTTPVAYRMLLVAEKSGKMGEMMERIATFHDGETARAIDWFTRLFEPLLMIFIGLLIGLVVVLLYLPIFELAGSLQ